MIAKAMMRAELQPDDGDHRHQRVLQRMAEIDGAVRQAAGAGELDVVGAQHLEHLGAHQPRHQGHLEQAERDRRQHQRLEAGGREQAGAPEADAHDLAAPEGGQHAERHGEDVDQQDADQEGRQRDADQRDRRGRACDSQRVRGGCRCRRPSGCRARWRTARPRARARASPASRSAIIADAPAASAGRRCRNRTAPRSARSGRTGPAPDR